MTHPYLRSAAYPRVLAHRGLVSVAAARQGVVDNSFAAVAEAHATGAEFVESDCHLTRDGVVVLLHDADLLRVAGDPRTVAEVGVDELDELLSERGGLLTLAQALDAFPSLRFNLDVKAAAAAGPVGRLVAAHTHRVLLTSFSDRRRRDALRAVRDAGASRPPATSPGRAGLGRLLAALALRSDRAATAALRGLDALQIPERHGRLPVLSRRLLDLAHRQGVEVHVWTVNSPHDMTRLLDLGVDGLVTDRADLAVPLARRRSSPTP